MKLLKHVLIPMRDGVRLSAHIVLPDAPGKFPAIFQYTPYHKGNPGEPGPRERHFAERGYAVLTVDIRGTGDSEGFTNSFSDPQQIADGVEVVEWIARQPWCDGNVGMMGISYVGFVCYQVAMHNPKPLKAIIVYQTVVDFYLSYACPGGSPRPFPYEQTAPLMTAYNAVPPNPELWGEEWANVWKQRLENGEPWGLSHVSNLLDGTYWRERSLNPDYERIKCATFFVGGWADWYPDDFLRAFAALKCPKKVLIGPWAHDHPDWALPLPRTDDWREVGRWFDQWLKGKDTGVTKEPPVTLFVQEFCKPDVARLEEHGFFRSENEWPPARAKETTLHLHASGALSQDEPSVRSTAFRRNTPDHRKPEPTEVGTPNGFIGQIEYDPSVGVAAGRYVIGQIPPVWGMPLDQRLDEPHSLVFTTEPLKEDTEVTGHPRAVLRASSTTDIAYFSVKLCDVAPDGTSALVSKGGLNATHRESHTNPTPLEPGKVYELKIDLQAIAYIFKMGHRIRVMIACADFQNAWPTPKPCVNTIHSGSRMLLPIVPPQNPKLPPPNLLPSEAPAPRREELSTPELAISRDLVRETTTVRYKNRTGVGINTSSFTVSSRNPAIALVNSDYEYRKELPGMNVVVRASCVTSSDEKAFHHVVELDITLNDRPHFRKSWELSVPRGFC